MMRRVAAATHVKVLASVVGVIALGLATPDAALACRATIGDFVWLDANRNGLQDPGEAGIPGVRVELLSADGTTVLKSTLTDANGYYTFTSSADDATEPPVCEVAYRVRVVTPTGLAATTIGVGTDVTIDSNDHTGAPVAALDSDGDTFAEDLTIDFGFVQPVVCTASIGNFVWNDLNNNGIQEAGEPGIAASAMTLSGASSATTTTSSTGIYAFTNLCAGTYTVCAGTPLGFQGALADQGANDALDSDGVIVGNNSCATVTLTSGQQNSTIDFGFWQKPTSGPGTGTPGYWKNHSEAWPVDSITIGGVTYSKDQALYWMGQPDGDKTITMFRSLVSAKLNVLIGNESSCVTSTIAAADAWMAQYGPVGSGIKARTAAWRVGEPLYWELDAYNNGDRCAPHRE